MIRILFLREREYKGKKVLAHTDLKLNLKAHSLADLYANAQAYIDLIPEAARFNVFYTMANQDESSADLRAFLSQSVIPIDIDKVDDKDRAKVAACVIKCLELDYTKTVVVFSGHGVHLFIDTGIEWTSPTYFEETRQNFKNMLGTLQKALHDSNLSGEPDPAVWDKSRIMRMPFSVNRKTGKPEVQCEIMQSILEPQPFNMAKYNMPPDGSMDINVVKRTTNIEKEGILSCPFLQHCNENPEDISEPQWFAMLGILAFIPEDGRDLCHKYSERYTSYDYAQTETKINHALKASGPRLCKSIEFLWEGCSSCPHRVEKAIATPFHIHTDEYVATQDTGFYNVVETKQGTKYVPDYAGLVKYFKQKHHFLSCSDNGQVFTYSKNNGAWALKSHISIQSFAKDHFVPEGKSNMWEEFKKWVQHTDPVGMDFFSTTKTAGKMNLKNGVLDVATGEITPHSPEHGFMAMVDVEYDPNATCPRFDQFMEEVTMGDKKAQDIILEYLGYVVGNVPCARFEKCLILTGVGSNGKSVLLDVLKHMIGTASFGSVRLSDLTDAAKRFELIGKIANIPSEEQSSTFKDSAIIKAMISGEAVQVKQLYAQPYSTKIEAKHIVACNSVPNSGDNSNGIFRRMLIIPFNAVFNHKLGNIDTQLREKLIKESSGILNRIIEGYKRLMANNQFSESQIVDEVNEEYRNDSDPMTVWLDETMVRLEGASRKAYEVKMIDVYESFKKWSERRNHFIISYNLFSKSLRQKLDKDSFKRKTDETGKFVVVVGYQFNTETGF